MSWVAYNVSDAVSTSKRKASSIAYSANGFILRQIEEVTDTRWRGLTKSAAQALVTGSGSLQSDSTTTTIYYRQIGTSNEIVAVGVTTGTKVDVVASRANEADGWEVVKTETSYSAGSTTGWSTTKPSVSSSGVEVSRDKRSSYVYSYSGNTLFSTEETVVSEFRYLTQSEAAAKVSSSTSNATSYTRLHIGSAVIVYREVITGTNVSATARYVDAEHGYTVTVTTTTYGWTQSGTSAPLWST